MGFTLRITNAPSGAASWKADFAGKSFDYDPIADSGWLGISQVWDYPSDPRDVATLRILVIDAQNNLLLHVTDLGPVNDGQDYEFNCSARELKVIAVEVPPVFHLAFVDTIFSAVWDISDWFLSGAHEVSGWIWPFYYLQYPLYGLHSVSWSLLTPIAHFGDWADDVAAKVSQVLTLEQITAYFSVILANATAAWDWVKNALGNVWLIIETWWSSTKLVVLAWIDLAKEEALTLISQVEAELANLRRSFDNIEAKLPSIDAVLAWWTSWAGNVISVINTWWTSTMGEVQDLINSAFTDRESWWAGWEDFRDKVAEFFSDPWEFLLERFTDWFLGPEE